MDAPLVRALSAISAFEPTSERDIGLAARARGLMIGYHERWKDAGWETLSVEETYHLPVVNPQTGAKSKTFTQAGKCDGVVQRDGKKYLLEHKTTSQDVSDPSAPYWGQLVINSQVSQYVLSHWQRGTKLDGTLYDVIRKPGIRPKNIPKADQAQIVAHGEYFGYTVPDEVRNNVARGQDRECGDLYACRLARDCINEPGKYFSRRVVPRLDSELTEYANELWEVGQSILSARKRNAHYRNSDSCMQYNTPCQYLGICAGWDSPESSNWVVAPKIHSEIAESEFPELNILTNSRVRTFQACRKKHYLRYEKGIQRRDSEESEALAFGSLIHSALESWFLCFRKDSDGSNSTAGGAGHNTEGACAQA